MRGCQPAILRCWVLKRRIRRLTDARQLIRFCYFLAKSQLFWRRTFSFRHRLHRRRERWNCATGVCREPNNGEIAFNVNIATSASNISVQACRQHQHGKSARRFAVGHCAVAVAGFSSTQTSGTINISIPNNLQGRANISIDGND